ncbi:hypothetical protein AWB75_06510 [Caballeronia catudaia]|uniref:Uncharacterized protein n=1 Tax=Caballeronia catudaia TaxID=1777136 RepID=A0A158DEE6_9BURK|nr:hypothetical protein AWB75_06510 [Caballeronia catudaia]
MSPIDGAATLPAKVSTTAPPAASGPGITTARGIYGNSDSPLQAIANPDGSLQLNQWDGPSRARKQVGAYQYRSDGSWWSGTDTASYRFAVASGTDENGNAQDLLTVGRTVGGAQRGAVHGPQT